MEHLSSLEANVGDSLPESDQVSVPAQVQFDFAATTAPPPQRELPSTTTAQFEEPVPVPDAEPRQSFGEWLLAQKDREGWIGDLGKAAKADRDFPKRGSPDEVRKRLQQMGADGDVFEALDDAELDWASL